MGSELSKNYADKAMFTAAPVENTGPRVYILNATPDPLGSITAMNNMYTGIVTRSLDQISDEEREATWLDVQKTVLKAPLESVSVHFLFEGVTRAFTHQLVRQRTAVYAQESMRFAVKENATDEVALPPSLMGVEPYDDVDIVRHATPEQEGLIVWEEAMETLGEAYNRLISLGVPAEDARGLLPTNILTRIHYVTNLRGLQDHAGYRLCTQAQFEWRIVWAGIVEAMRFYNSCGGHETAEESAACRICDNWEWKKIATIFKPICYQTGKCEFMANIDRHCSIRNRVQANHDLGRKSTEWDETYDPNIPVDAGFVSGFNYATSVVRDGPDNKPVFIGAIQPREWMADPSAARIRK